MDAPRPSDGDSGDITVELDGARWSVQEIGATRSGASPDGGAILLLLAFTPVAAPSGTGEREVLVAAPSLAHLSQEDLEEAFVRSRSRRSGGARFDGAGAGDTEEGVSL